MDIPQNDSHLASPGHVVKAGFEQFKNKFGKAVALALPALGAIILLKLAFYRFLSMYGKENFKGGYEMISAVSAGDYRLLILIVLLGIVYGVLAVFFGISLVNLFGNDEHIVFKQYFAMAKPYFWPYIWVSVLSGIIVMGGLALLIIPGLLFWVWFSMAPYVMVLENRWGMEALMRSKQLVRDRFWGVVGRLFLIIIAVIALTIPLIIVSAIFKDNIIASDIFSQIYTFFVVAPFTVACIVSLLRDLRDTAPAFSYNRKEGVKFILLGLLGIAVIPALLIGSMLKYFLMYQNLFNTDGNSPYLIPLNDDAVIQDWDGVIPLDMMDIDLQNSY